MTVPPRPRDFRLSKRDLGGSRTRGRWSMEGVRRALRPAGTALAALGVAGLLLAGTTALGGLASFGSSGAAAPAAAPPRDANFEARPSGGAAGAVASPAAAAATGAAQPARGASSPAPSPAAPGVLGVPSPSPSGAAGGAATADKSTDLGRQAGPIPPAAPPAGPSPLVVASVALLAAGIGFIVASRFLRPRGDRPD